MNWETIVVALIVALAPALLGVAAIVTSFRTNRKVDKTNVVVDEYHAEVNSKMDKLLELIEQRAYAAGLKNGEIDPPTPPRRAKKRRK